MSRRWRVRRHGGLALGLCTLLLAGCAKPPATLYQWDGYQRQVYEYLNGDGKPQAEQLTVLQAQAEKTRAEGRALPPGFRAHLGLLHIQMGSLDEARQLLEAEKLAFPESTPYMDFLLKRTSAQPAPGTPPRT
jgi:hypothetical protein